MISIQNIDGNECFKRGIVRPLNPANHHPARIIKAYKDFAKKLKFKNKIFIQNYRNSPNWKKRISLALVILAMKIKKSIQSMYQKSVVKKNIDLLSIKEVGKIHYVLSKDFITFMYNNNLHHRKNIFVVFVHNHLVQKKY